MTMNAYPDFGFRITHRDPQSNARCGILTTPHGEIETPNFIFCATKAAMKGATMDQVKEAGADIILSNTYHLMLQPGADTIEKLGGLHKATGWDGPMLTDSGGFQIFSLGHGGVVNEIKGSRTVNLPKTLLKVEEDGAVFRSYLDGAIHTLTPEISIAVQRKLGADLILVLDECTPYHSDREYTARSMERSHRWAQRSMKAFQQSASGDNKQALYGIVQGGVHPELRKESASFVASEDFFGQAVGGTLGGTKAEMYSVVEQSCRYLNPERPTHLLGIGGVRDIWQSVVHGIDTFDCVHPTRLARHGGALMRPQNKTDREHLNVKNARFREDTSPIDPSCPCYCCRNYSLGYLHHLFKAGEYIGGTLLTIHNIHFMVRLAKVIREAIREDRLEEAAKNWGS